MQHELFSFVLHSKVPGIDTSSIVSVLVSVISIAFLVVVVLWRLIGKLSKDKEAANKAIRECMQKHTDEKTELLRENWKVQEQLGGVLREINSNQENVHASISSLQQSFTQLNLWLGSRGSDLPNSHGGSDSA